MRSTYRFKRRIAYFAISKHFHIQYYNTQNKITDTHANTERHESLSKQLKTAFQMQFVSQTEYMYVIAYYMCV